MRLYKAILSLVEDASLTYRQIADKINDRKLYIPPDGSLVTVENVRAAVREHEELFQVDRTRVPHKVKARSGRRETLGEAPRIGEEAWASILHDLFEVLTHAEAALRVASDQGPRLTLREVMELSGITEEELAEIPDVDLDDSEDGQLLFVPAAFGRLENESRAEWLERYAVDVIRRLFGYLKHQYPYLVARVRS